ncbi:3-oxo-tetronate 4-phosphate decarboxylase [Saccharomonospora sp. NPDC046836]|uniref:3-oxo-tetronate 4-phosphate decarboxylase n=1 Tax=Saccharomonospora sp. NPDC046836 TaxID=3156921 RepID=UPI0033CCD221
MGRGAAGEAAREEVVRVARSMFDRGLTHGSTGNVSLRLGEEILVTPTGCSLGTVAPEDLSSIDLTGKHVAGPRPSKEAFLHAAVLRARPAAEAVVHTHSTHAAAVSCLADRDPQDCLPPLTAYYGMRVGCLPLLPYHAPGDAGLEPLAERTARTHHAMLLANHGPVVAGASLAAALDAVEELEETAKLFFLLRGSAVRPLTATEFAALRKPRNSR